MRLLAMNSAAALMMAVVVALVACSASAASLRDVLAVMQRQGWTKHRALLNQLDASGGAASGRLSFAEWSGQGDLPLRCLEANEQFLDAFDAYAATVIQPPPERTAADADKAIPLMVSLVRHWSAEGADQRRGTVERILYATRSYVLPSVPAGAKVRVLVPGSGLGRIAFEVAKLDAERINLMAVERDMSSVLMLAFLLNGKAEADAATQRVAATRRFTVYPALHLASNWKDATARFRPVLLPDVDTAGTHFALGIGAFPEREGAVPRDVVVTSFFLDAGDPVEFIQGVHKVLSLARQEAWEQTCAADPQASPECAAGGKNVFWINDGPLVYPYSDGHALILAYDQVRDIMLAVGFKFIEESVNKCEFEHLPGQMEKRDLVCFFFVATLS
jgi:hypothetical protein